MDTKDLWPDFGEIPKITSPRSILAEQATFFTEKTKNILSAQIAQASSNDGTITNYFRIIAPLLKSYKYTLFTVKHQLFYYPCELIFNNSSTTIKNEEGLIDRLSEVFNHPETKRIITSLLGQSMDIEGSES